ncbi:MAG: AAA family ATPase [Desulfobacteraceae bacterium]|nr:AAA family ATPase [Desulfobacteraceae bacterium]
MTRIISVVSGNRKVGKTTLCVNVAHLLSGQGAKVCLFSFDLAAGRHSLPMGICPEYDLTHVLTGAKRVKDILIRTGAGIDLLPGNYNPHADGKTMLEQVSQLGHYMSELDGDYDYLVLDPPGGITRQAVACCLACPETYVTFTPDSKGLNGAYDFLKVLSKNGFNEKANMVICKSRYPEKAPEAFEKLNQPVARNLQIPLRHSPTISFNPRVTSAEQKSLPLFKIDPEAVADMGIKAVAERIIGNPPDSSSMVGLELFWEQLSMISQFPLDFAGVDAEAYVLDAVAPVKSRSVPQTQSPPVRTDIVGDLPSTDAAASPPTPQRAASPAGEALPRTATVGEVVSSPGLDLALSRIAAGIENISHELVTLREMIGKGIANISVPEDTDMRPQDYQTLDFDAFLAERKKSTDK